MPTFKSFAPSLLTACALALGGSVAQADVLVAHNAPAPASQLALVFDGVGGNSSVGAFALSNQGDSNAILNGSFLGFCVEPLQSISIAAATGGEASYTGSIATPSAAVQRLFDLDYATAVTSSANAASFGLALQELTFETSGSYSLTSGTFKRLTAPSDAFSAQAITAANTLLDSVLSSPDATTHMQILSFQSPNSQDFLTAIPASIPVTPAVPEPETYALLLAGLGALGFVSRRRTSRS